MIPTFVQCRLLLTLINVILIERSINKNYSPITFLMYSAVCFVFAIVYNDYTALSIRELYESHCAVDHFFRLNQGHSYG